MSDIRFGEPTREEAMELATRLKKSDVDEVFAAAAITPSEAMQDTYDSGRKVIGAYVDGRLEMVFGVNPDGYPKGWAAVWMVSSAIVFSHGKSLVKLGNKWLDEVQQQYGVLFNFVDVRATATLRWLMRMGFCPNSVISYGVHGMPFMLVTRGN